MSRQSEPQAPARGCCSIRLHLALWPSWLARVSVRTNTRSDALGARIACALLILVTPRPISAEESGGRILSPSLGRPAFVQAGGELTIAASLANGDAVSEVRL